MPSLTRATHPCHPRTARTFSVLALMVTAGALAVLTAASDPAQGARMVIRVTARTSLVLFLLSFLASALARLWPTPTTSWLLQHRRAFGLGFAFSHGVHLVAIVAFAQLDGPAFMQQTSVGNLITGGIAYAFIALMAASSWDGAVRWLGRRRWQLLHAAGAYYLWVSFVVSFGKRIAVSPWYGLAVVVLVAALALKLTAARHPRTVARAAGPR